MKNFQKLGGIAALYMAASYIVAMVFYLLVVDYTGVVDPVEKLALIVDNQTGLYIMNLITFVIAGIALVVLVLAVYERLKAGSKPMVQTATAFGLIWAGLVIASGMVFSVGMGSVVDLFSTDPAQAATVWLAIDSVFNGLGGGNEIVGAIWMLLLSWAALRAGEFPKVLNYLGLIISAAGILSAVPALGEIGGLIFGLGQIIWFLWLGIAMLRGSSSVAALNPDALVQGT